MSLYLLGTETTGKEKNLFSLMLEQDILPCFIEMKQKHIMNSLKAGMKLSAINTHAVLTIDGSIPQITSFVVDGVPTKLGKNFKDNDISVKKYAQQSSPAQQTFDICKVFPNLAKAVKMEAYLNPTLEELAEIADPLVLKAIADYK